MFYDREKEDRNAIALGLCERQKAVFVPPFDDPLIIAGQGTAGLELMQQAGGAAQEITAVLAPASGGGLIAGVGLAAKHFNPGIKIFCVEPEGFDDYARSLASGQREKNARSSGSICDALLVGAPGEKTFAVNKAQLTGGFAVSDDEALDAIAFAYHELKLVVEPGGVVALAALLSGRYKPSGTVAIILSGGNIDPELFGQAIARSI